MPLEGLRWASIFAHTGTAAWYQRDVVPYMRERVGFLHYMKPSRGVSEPHVVQFPRLAAAKPRREAVCSPNCRPIGQRTLKIGHFEAMGLHFGGIGVCKRVG